MDEKDDMQARTELIEASARVALRMTGGVPSRLMKVAAEKFLMFYACEKPSPGRDERQFASQVANEVRADFKDADTDKTIIASGIRFACRRLAKGFRELGDQDTARVLGQVAYSI